MLSIDTHQMYKDNTSMSTETPRKKRRSLPTSRRLNLSMPEGDTARLKILANKRGVYNATLVCEIVEKALNGELVEAGTGKAIYKQEAA